MSMLRSVPLTVAEVKMAREGYLILDSDLHMMEPDDLWTRYLDEPYRANAPRFFGAQQQKLADDSEDKGNADVIEPMEVQGLAIPAHGKMPSAAAVVIRMEGSHDAVPQGEVRRTTRRLTP